MCAIVQASCPLKTSVTCTQNSSPDIAGGTSRTTRPWLHGRWLRVLRLSQPWHPCTAVQTSASTLQPELVLWGLHTLPAHSVLARRVLFQDLLWLVKLCSPQVA